MTVERGHFARAVAAAAGEQSEAARPLGRKVTVARGHFARRRPGTVGDGGTPYLAGLSEPLSA